MKQIKAIFFDVDGTIYAHRIHDIPQSTRMALTQLKEQGFKLGVSTSRCRFETRHLPSFFHEFPFDANFYDGGALVMEKDQIVMKTPIDPEIVAKVMNICKEEHIPIRYSTFDQDHFGFACDSAIYDNFFKLYLNMPSVKPYEFEEVFNLLAYPQNEKQFELIQSFETELHLIVHGSKTIELTAKGINKSKGIEAMAKYWHMDAEEIACFGDGYNDIQMLTMAGLGVAMGNAYDPVKQAADAVCGSVEEDGIYTFCKEAGWI